uniref:Uncharacterized protein n=1 Tax=viral metagenome TaxID=1070528 RepID=A0A6C0L0M9_9ZZZZ|tara:strand:- start:4954 stop:5697 length:744 start_codon:yes stop_codon:yes gene_type:complete
MKTKILLKIEKDKEFPYMCLTEYNIVIYGNSFKVEQKAQKLRHIELQFLCTQKANYNSIEVNKTFELIEDYFSFEDSSYLINFSYSYYSDYKDFLRDITNRLNIVNRKRKLEIRAIKSILGSFEESISPKMIHKILTWLKKKDFPKYGSINRGIKEQIIMDLRIHQIFISPKLLCEFIDNTNPMLFVKEWKIQTHINGKRMTNVQIRKLLKNAFYKREKECIRFRIICPSLNCLPKNVENLIISYME